MPPSSPPSSEPLEPQPDVNAVPPGPENTKLLKQSCEIDPSRTVKVKPSPAGTVEPVNEKPNTTTSETLTVNPFAAA